MIEIHNNDEFRNVIATNEKSVMFFGSKNCHHCLDMSKFLKSHANSYPGVVIGHIETTKVPVAGLNAVPLFLLYDNGQLFDYQLGAGSEKLDSLIQTLMDSSDVRREDDIAYIDLPDINVEEEGDEAVEEDNGYLDEAVEEEDNGYFDEAVEDTEDYFDDERE